MDWVMGARPMLAVITLLGCVMFFSSAILGSGEAPPFPTMDWRQWKPIWKTKAWYRPPGHMLAIWGWILFTIGGLGLAVLSLFR